MSVASAAMFAACDDDSQDAVGPAASGNGVYFANDVVTSYSATSSADEITFTVYRKNTESAYDLTLDVTGSITVADETAETPTLTCPETVSFAAGESSADFTFSYANLSYNDEVDVTISLPEDEVNPYGVSKLSFTIEYPEPWSAISGTATITENFWMGETYTCSVEKNDVVENQYRLVAPFPESDYGTSCDYLTFTIYKAGETLGGEVLTQDVVYYDEFDLAYSSTYSGQIAGLFPNALSSCKTQDTWTANYVEEYQEDGTPGILHIAPIYYFASGDYAGYLYLSVADYLTGAYGIDIIMPGVEVTDYSASIAYTGESVYDSNGTLQSIYAKIGMGADVATAQAAIVKGSDVETAMSAIVDGSVESVAIAGGDTTIVTLPMPSTEAGLYSMVVVTFDAEGTAKGYAYADYRQYNSSVTYTAWDLSAAKVGDFEYAALLEGTQSDMVLVPGETDAETGSQSFYISDWFAGVNFTFVVNKDYTITYEAQSTGYGEIMVMPLASTGISGAENFVGYYDEDCGAFHFFNYYYDSEGGYSINSNANEEIFYITGEYEAEEASASAVRGVKSVSISAGYMPKGLGYRKGLYQPNFTKVF